MLFLAGEKVEKAVNIVQKRRKGEEKREG